jgi:RHS repeat-associated protein
MAVDGQTTVSYTYDNAHRLTAIARGAATVAITYDDADRRSTLTYPNGIVATYAYDNANQLTSIAYTLDSSPVGDLTYTYDLAGNRTSVGGSWARTGLPAALGSATYDAANRLTAWDATDFTYDLNGNLIDDETNTYTWNARNQLSGISGGVSASFAYDAFGRRRSKTVSSTTTNFLYDGLNFVQELTSGGTPTANVLTGLGIDETFTRSVSGATETLLADALGSTIALANESGTVQTEYTYEPFGQTSSSGSSSANATHFTGRENDDGTRLYAYRSRYYLSEVGRFISEDAIGLVSGTNLYEYVGGDPVAYVDPLGLDKCKPPQLVPLPKGLKWEPGPGSKNLIPLFSPEFAGSLANAILTLNDAGVVPQINNAFRAPGVQQNLDSGGNPLAAPGQSLHELGEAVDINGVNQIMISAMGDAGLNWGGRFKTPDRPHFYRDPFAGDLAARREAVRRLQDWWKRCGGKR